MNFKYNTKQRTKSVQGLRSFKDTLPQEAKRILNKKGQIYDLHVFLEWERKLNVLEKEMKEDSGWRQKKRGLPSPDRRQQRRRAASRPRGRPRSPRSRRRRT